VKFNKNSTFRELLCGYFCFDLFGADFLIHTMLHEEQVISSPHGYGCSCFFPTPSIFVWNTWIL